MPCFYPIRAWRGKRLSKTGKRPLVFRRSEGFKDMQLDVSCGRCIGCRLERSRQWALRCVHESSLHASNSFVTLTYDDKHLPSGGTLVLRDFQLFMKRLRKRFGPGIRFFHCGEYGDRFWRPHYHACLFGFQFPDLRLWSVRNGVSLYTSEICQEVWQNKGYCVVGDVTFESAAYVARYVMKKITGEAAAEHYKGRLPEYVTMSRRPGLASAWFDKFQGDVFPHDYMIINGKKCKVPRFFDDKFALMKPEEFARVKARRVPTPAQRMDNDSFRLPVKEQIAKERLSKLKRSHDD